MPDLKGHTFTADSPLVPQSIKDGDPDALEAYVAAENARWAIVKACPVCGESLVAEELAAHWLSHVPEDIRVQVGDLLLLEPSARRRVLVLFDQATGEFVDD